MTKSWAYDVHSRRDLRRFRYIAVQRHRTTRSHPGDDIMLFSCFPYDSARAGRLSHNVIHASFAQTHAITAKGQYRWQQQRNKRVD